MTVSFRKDAHVLVVHGVQRGSAQDIALDVAIERLVRSALARSHLERPFTVSQYVYEDINDNSLRLFDLIARAVLRNKPIAGRALREFIDLAGDVLIAVKASSTAAKIRRGLRNQILSAFERGNQTVLVAHSLGTVYALDVINELIAEDGLFQGDDLESWPVQSLVTLGSPLGLAITLGPLTVFESRPIAHIDAEFELFGWYNYFSSLDPIVSGNVFGKPLPMSGSNGPVELRYGEATRDANWLLRGERSSAGKQWAAAHTSYWKNGKIGDQLIQLLWG